MPMFDLSSNIFSANRTLFGFLSNIYQNIFSLFSEPRESVYIKASRNEEYQQFEEWRSSLIRYVVLIEKHILKDIRPQLLHKMIVLEQSHMFKYMQSPFFYYEYFKILEQNLSPDTPVVFSYILRDARVRLREKLIKQPQLALDYFYKDILFQLIRLSGKKTNVKRFKQMIHYYKKLVTEGIYTSVRDDIKEFLKNYTNDDPTKIDTNELPYIQLQEKIDHIFEEYNPPVEKQVEKKLITQAKEHPQLIALAILSLLAGGWCALSAKENEYYGLQSFNLANSNLDPFLANSILHYFSWQYTWDVKFAPSTQVVSTLLSLSSLMGKTYAFVSTNNTEYKFFKNTDEPITFYNVYNWTNGDAGAANSIWPTSDGGCIMLGTTTGSDVTFLVKLSKYGEIQWKKNTTKDYFYGWAVRQISDETYITVGESSVITTTTSLMIVNWSGQGDILFAGIINWPYTFFITSLQAMNDGFAVMGYLDGDNHDAKIFMAKWDNKLSLNWVKVISIEGSIYPTYFQLFNNGDLIVTGNILLNSKNDSDIFLWNSNIYNDSCSIKVFGTPNPERAHYFLSSNNTYTLVGFAIDNGDRNDFLLNVDENDLLWAIKLSSSAYSIGMAQQLSTGGLIVAGAYKDNSTDVTKSMLLQLTTNGVVILSKFLNATAKNSGFTNMWPALDNGFIVMGHNDWTCTMVVKLDSQADLINCPSLVTGPSPITMPISFQTSIENITIQTLLFNFSSMFIRSYDATLDIITFCSDENDKPGNNDSFWAQVFKYSAVVAGFLLLLGVIGFLYYKNTKAAKKILNHQKQAEYIREFSFDKIVKYEELGKGGFGEVFRGAVTSPNFPKGVAIKKLYFGEEKKEVSLEASLMREIKLMRQLDHPNIVRLFGYSVNPLKNEYYIVMELVPNRSLAEALYIKIREDEYENVTTLTWRQRFDIAIGIASGLTLLHGYNPTIIHTDLKSYNVLLDDNYNPKICDFGLAKVFDAAGRNAISSGKSIPDGEYVAPELKDSECTPNEKTDMYSYGVILNEMINAKMKTEENIDNNTNDEKNILIQKAVDSSQEDESYKNKMTALMKKCMFYDFFNVLASQKERPSALEAIDYLEDRKSHGAMNV